jgi:hypothetical protein
MDEQTRKSIWWTLHIFQCYILTLYTGN